MLTPQDLGQSQYPPPRDWERFERLCCDLWKAIWKDPNTKRHGRGGQPQHGVDVCGRVEGDGWGGVQCKKKDAFADHVLTVDDLRDVVEDAKNFEPALSVFIVAYTGRSDQKLQRTARLLTDEHGQVGLFRVEVCSWDDIVEASGDHPEVFSKHFAGSSNVDAREVAKGLKAIHSTIESIPERLAGIQKEQIEIIASTSSRVAAEAVVLEQEHNSELDHAKDLIGLLKHKEALDYLEKLESRIFTGANATIRFRLLTNKAVAKTMLGQEKAAGELFIQAHQYRPDDEKALCNRAAGHLFLGQKEEALVFARKALEKNPANPGPHEVGPVRALHGLP